MIFVRKLGSHLITIRNPIALQLRELGSDRSSVVAVEFALVFSLFIVLVLAVLELGLLFFARAALDSGTQAAARTLQLGIPNPDPNAITFQDALCKQVSGLMNCNNLHYYVQDGSSFSAMNPTIFNGTEGTYPTPPSPTGTAPGAVGATPYMIIQVSYQWDFLTGPIIGAFHSFGPVLVSTAAFEHE